MLLLMSRGRNHELIADDVDSAGGGRNRRRRRGRRGNQRRGRRRGRESGGRNGNILPEDHGRSPGTYYSATAAADDVLATTACGKDKSFTVIIVGRGAVVVVVVHNIGYDFTIGNTMIAVFLILH